MTSKFSKSDGAILNEAKTEAKPAPAKKNIKKKKSAADEKIDVWEKEVNA